jgi:prostatin (serine protease 8)
LTQYQFKFQNQIFQVSVAEHDLSIFTEAPSFYRRVVQVVSYPTWHSGASVMGDLVLIKLDIPVEFSRTAKPICLPADMAPTFANQVATSIGWGITEDGTPSRYLRKVRFFDNQIQTTF